MSSTLPATVLFEHPFAPRRTDARYLAGPLAGHATHSALAGDLFPREERPVRREGLQLQR